MKVLIEREGEGNAEGFVGMLYIHETPIHFGLIIVSCILLLLGVIYGFYDYTKKEKRLGNSWLSFSYVLFLFFTFTIFLLMIYHLPATATADQLFPYFMALWSCYALYAFYAIFYVFSADYFQRWLWLRYLFLIGTISFLALLWFLATPATTFVVFDGVMNWLAMPLAMVAYGGVLWFFYLVLFPFLLVYQVNKQRTHPIRTGNCLVFLGGLLLDIGALLIALVLFLASATLIALGLAALGMIITLIGSIINLRAPSPTPKTEPP